MGATCVADTGITLHTRAASSQPKAAEPRLFIAPALPDVTPNRERHRPLFLQTRDDHVRWASGTHATVTKELGGFQVCCGYAN